MSGIYFSLSLVLALVTLSTSQQTKCDLAGLWRNELGSLLEIRDINEVGEFSGQYLTAVTTSSNCIRISPLRGVQHHTMAKAHPVFGFTVNWEFSNSTTVFVGQCFADALDKEILKTVWLLGEAVESIDEHWQATRIGTNDFIREQSLEQREILQKLCGTPAVPSP